MNLLPSLVAFGARVVARSRGRQTADRVLLERTILPSYAARADVRRLLFVGCARFTTHYAQLFAGAEYWTIDPAPHRQRWGAQRHIVGRLEELAQHAPATYFDVIVCNGVLGWGLDLPRDADAAFAECFRALRPGGELLIGWNDFAPRNRVRPEDLPVLARFERNATSPVRQWRINVPGAHRHVFDFYRRPVASHADSNVGASGAGAHADSGRHVPSTHIS